MSKRASPGVAAFFAPRKRSRPATAPTPASSSPSSPSSTSAAHRQRVVRLPQGGRLTVLRGYLRPAERRALFATLRASLPFAPSRRQMWGKAVLTPREQCWMGDASINPTRYPTQRVAWSDELGALRDRVSAEFAPAHRPLNFVLVNLYRGGADSVAWHNDEDVIEDSDVIVSVSLGATRRFSVKPMRQRAPTASSTPPPPAAAAAGAEPTRHFELADGDVVVMDGLMQRHYLHTVPKTKRPVGPRINLTFRRGTEKSYG